MSPSTSSRPDTGAGDQPHGDLRNMVGHLLRRAQQLHASLWAESVAGGITSPQYAVLRVLAEESDIPQGRVGELAALDRSSLAEMVNRLVERDWVRRRRDPVDGRRSLLSLGPRGREILREATPGVEEVNRRLVANLGEQERDELTALLVRLLESPWSLSFG
ncbi:MAG TPA: MarR family transcriptional regulator [Acidimicrobiales bacterium]|nr:MarR family transcriptional regulator [Acidimicrobiales bacterium]